MALVATDSGGSDFQIAPQGTHTAICNMVVDLGNQETSYQGQTKTKHQVWLRWELPQERIEWTDKDGNEKEGPMSLGRTYTCSLSEKANLRKDLEGWRGKAFSQEELEGFDLFNLLGVPCQVTVTHREANGKTYANVTGVAGWPKAVDKPKETENKAIKYSADDPKQFDDLPEWLQEKIKGATELAPYVPKEGEKTKEPLDDEIPF
jgi:hypothetical protein